MAKHIFAACLLLVLCMTGCYKTQIINGNATATFPAGVADDAWNHNGIFRLVNFSGPHNLRQICPNGWAKIETRVGFVAGFVDWVLYAAGGIGVWGYAPQNYTVWCVNSTAQAIELNGHGDVVATATVPARKH